MHNKIFAMLKMYRKDWSKCMESVLVRLREYYDQASNTEKSIISFLLENPEEAAEMSIHQLADRVYASASTITRLCHKTGFPQYKRFQKSLLYELAVRKENVLGLDYEIHRDDALENLVDKITYKSIASLEDTRSLIDIGTLEKCLDLLQNARMVSFFGIGASLLVAKDAYLKFLRINKPCQVCEDFHAQLVQAKIMGRQDVAIIISYSGQTSEIISCAKILKSAQVPMIAITCFKESPLSKLTDYNLYVTATEYAFKTGKLASRLAQLNVIDILYVAYIQRNYDTCMVSLKKTYISKTDRSEGKG